ncbi:hexosyltransferase [Plakobranchus ocellatus]|uniref:Hexosyltransferase n=1 Tax=Plakobranchus ocellatus TaxID=259542 RepID=A0AAV4AE79_9GAST|nr:hexosyltransferase [Plakobranchus ocellatus]
MLIFQIDQILRLFLESREPIVFVSHIHRSSPLKTLVKESDKTLNQFDLAWDFVNNFGYESSPFFNRLILFRRITPKKYTYPYEIRSRLKFLLSEFGSKNSQTIPITDNKHGMEKNPNKGTALESMSTYSESLKLGSYKSLPSLPFKSKWNISIERQSKASRASARNDKLHALNDNYEFKHSTLKAGDQTFPQTLEPLPNICNGVAPFLLVLIAKRPSNRISSHQRMTRKIIRRKLASVLAKQPRHNGGEFKSSFHARSPKDDLTIMFISGKETSRPAEENALLREQAVYRDLLLVNISENSESLPSKIASALTWLYNCCPGTRFVLVTTDDMLINSPFLVKFISLFSAHISSLADSKVHSDKTYNFHKEFRDSLQVAASMPFSHGRHSKRGPAPYVISGEAIPELLQKMRTVAGRFLLEDEILGGVDVDVTKVWRISAARK